MVLKRKDMGGSKQCIYTRIIYRVYKRVKDIAPKLLLFGFFDEFRSKNGLPASVHIKRQDVYLLTFY
jgi:hypothetical protein